MSANETIGMIAPEYCLVNRKVNVNQRDFTLKKILRCDYSSWILWECELWTSSSSYGERQNRDRTIFGFIPRSGMQMPATTPKGNEVQRIPITAKEYIGILEALSIGIMFVSVPTKTYRFIEDVARPLQFDEEGKARMGSIIQLLRDAITCIYGSKLRLSETTSISSFVVSANLDKIWLVDRSKILGTNRPDSELSLTELDDGHVNRAKVIFGVAVTSVMRKREMACEKTKGQPAVLWTRQNNVELLNCILCEFFDLWDVTFGD